MNARLSAKYANICSLCNNTVGWLTESTCVLCSCVGWNLQFDYWKCTAEKSSAHFLFSRRLNTANNRRQTQPWASSCLVFTWSSHLHTLHITTLPTQLCHRLYITLASTPLYVYWNAALNGISDGAYSVRVHMQTKILTAYCDTPDTAVSLPWCRENSGWNDKDVLCCLNDLTAVNPQLQRGPMAECLHSCDWSELIGAGRPHHWPPWVTYHVVLIPTEFSSRSTFFFSCFEIN